jgi:hypothetical protein
MLRCLGLPRFTVAVEARLSELNPLHRKFDLLEKHAIIEETG